MMNKKSLLIIGIALFLMLAGSLCYLIFNINSSIRIEAVESEKNFSRLVTETADSAEFFGFMTENFIAHQKQLQSRSAALKVLLISDAKGLVYASPVQTGTAGFDRNGIPVVKTSSPFDKTLSSTITIQQTGTVTVTAVYSLLRHDAALFYLRNTFLIILAVTILSLIVILAAKTENTAAKQPEPEIKENSPIQNDAAQTPAATESAADRESAVATTVDFDATNIPDEENGLYDFPESPEDTAGLPVETPYIEQVPPPTAELQPADEQPVAAEPVPEIASYHEPEQNYSSDEMPGLFSKATGVCCEPYLSDRLGTELSRAVESEQDIALFIIRIDHLDRLDMVSRKIAAYLISQFKFRDLIFEWGKDGFAVIAPAATFDSAMKAAETMYTEILSVLNTAEYSKRLAIGFSLRTGRILPGERFLKEAANACEKAINEPEMPVVAFRADPDKYRNFISEK